MRRFLLALLAASALGLSACRSVTASSDVSDPAIKARIEAALSGRKELDLRYVAVDVNMGVAVISGIVPDEEQMNLIRSLAAKVRGVDQVLNNLVVRE